MVVHYSIVISFVETFHFANSKGLCGIRDMYMLFTRIIIPPMYLCFTYIDFYLEQVTLLDIFDSS